VAQLYPQAPGLQQSQSHIATDGQSISKSWCRAPSGAIDQIFIILWQLRSCFCWSTSLTRGRVCLSYMLLALASVVFLGSETLRTREHIKKSQSHVTTDGHSANLSWCQEPIWGFRPDFYYCQTATGLLMWGALSDERTGLPFTIADGPRQRSQFWVWVSRDSWPYHFASDSRLPQPGGPGPRIYIPKEQGGPVISPDTGYCQLTFKPVPLITHWHGPNRKHCLLLYSNRFRGNVFICEGVTQ
jgi:hypothetical protein